MFQVQFGELCTIIPAHFRHMPGLHEGTKCIDLVEPSFSQKVGLLWADEEPMMPMAGAMVTTVRKLQKSGEMKRRLGQFALDPQGQAAASKADIKETSRRTRQSMR
jgi:hypothetical protein